MTPWVYSGQSEPSPWLAEDLSPPNAEHPFAIGIDAALIDAPVPAGWNELASASIDPLPGESDQQLLVVDRPTGSCAIGQHVGLVSADGIVIGSVLWEHGRQATGPTTRGWAIVPRAADYSVWCSN